MANFTAHRPGGNSQTGRVYMDMVKAYDIGPDDLTSLVYRIPVDADRTIVNVRARVKTVFDGTSPTVKIGDLSTSDGYLKLTDLDITSRNAMAQSLNRATVAAGAAPAFTQGSDTFTVGTPDTFTQGTDTFDAGDVTGITFNSYAQGKYYSAASQILVTFTANNMTDGLLGVEIVYSGNIGAERDEVEGA